MSGVPEENNHFFQTGHNRRKVQVSEEAQAGIDAYIEYVATQQGSCCPLTDEGKESAPVLFGKYKDAGKGNMQRGINIRDDEARDWSKTNKTASKVFDIILKVLVGAFAVSHFVD